MSEEDFNPRAMDASGARALAFEAEMDILRRAIRTLGARINDIGVRIISLLGKEEEGATMAELKAQQAKLKVQQGELKAQQSKRKAMLTPSGLAWR